MCPLWLYFVLASSWSPPFFASSSPEHRLLCYAYCNGHTHLRTLFLLQVVLLVVHNHTGGTQTVPKCEILVVLSIPDKGSPIVGTLRWWSCCFLGRLLWDLEDSHLMPWLLPKVFVSDGRKCRLNNDLVLVLTSQLRCGTSWYLLNLCNGYVGYWVWYSLFSVFPSSARNRTHCLSHSRQPLYHLSPYFICMKLFIHELESLLLAQLSSCHVRMRMWAHPVKELSVALLWALVGTGKSQNSLGIQSGH